jgi:hypothetical protein
MPLTARPPESQPSIYRTVLGSRHVLRLLAGTLVGRLPNAMAPVAVVLLITADGMGSLAFGGLLGALYLLGSGLSQPVKGRLLARYGQTRVSGIAVGINAGSLLALAAAGSSAPAFVATALVVVAGLCTPPLEAGLRALWPLVLPDPSERRAALALDTGTQGFLFIAGPLLVASLTSAHGPSASLVATALLGLLGAVVVLTAAPSRNWRAARVGHTRAPSPLRTGGLRLLFVAMAGVGLAVGGTNVWAVNMAERHHMDLLSGLIPAAFSTGSFLGGLVFGRRAWPGSITTQLLASAGGFAAGWLPLLTVPSPSAAVALIVVPGLFLPLVTACAFMTVDKVGPIGSTTEGYAWLILSVGVGASAGTALAGTLAEHQLAGPALPAVGAAFALAVLTAARRLLTIPAPAHATPKPHEPDQVAAPDVAAQQPVP